MKKQPADKLFERMPGKVQKLHEQARAERRQNKRQEWKRANLTGGAK